MSLSLVICPVAAEPNKMILSGRATERTRRTISFSNVSSTPIRFHDTRYQASIARGPRETGRRKFLRRRLGESRLGFGSPVWVRVDAPSLVEVCRRYGVKELSLFGSAVRGEMRPDSDIDIMVEFEPCVRIGLIKFESLVEELQSLAGRRVDLVTERGLKPWVSPQVLEAPRSSMRHEPSFLKDILS